VPLMRVRRQPSAEAFHVKSAVAQSPGVVLNMQPLVYRVCLSRMISSTVTTIAVSSSCGDSWCLSSLD